MTLIEIIIVMGLVSILFTLVFLEAQMLTISRGQRYEDIAYHVANKKMEELRSADFSSLPSSGTISDPQLSSIPSGAGSFTITNYQSYTGMKQLTVTVTWSNNGSKSVTLNTLAGDGGLNQ